MTFLRSPSLLCASAVTLIATASTADARPATAPAPTSLHSHMASFVHGGVPTSPLDLDYDVLAYALGMKLSTADDSFTGRVSVLLAATADDTTEIVLGIGVQHTEGDISFNPYEVTAVRNLFGWPMTYTQDPDAGTLTVELPWSLHEGEVALLVVDYAGELNPFTSGPYANVGMLKSVGLYDHETIQSFGWPNHARRWMPSHDTPADPAMWFATLEIDSDKTLLSNGTPLFRSTHTDDDGNTVSRASFAMAQPVPTYAMQVMAGDFVHLTLRDASEGIPIEAYVYPEDEAAALEAWADIPAAFDHLVDRLGPYRFPHYAMIEVPSTFGGMEHATIVSIADTALSLGSARTTGIHELTHHWFGDNLYQSEWQAFWLNESLAEYLTAETLGFLDGPEAFLTTMLGDRNIVFNVPHIFNQDALHFAVGEVPFEATPTSFYAPYYKGPWVWEMVRTDLGDDLFFAWLYDYIQTNQFSPWDSARVIDAVQTYTGRTVEYLGELVYQAGWPQVSTELAYDGAAQTATLTVRQVQDVDAFGTYTLAGELALQFALDDGDEATPACAATVAFEAASVEETVTVPCAAAPTTAILANGDHLLVEVTE